MRVDAVRSPLAKLRPAIVTAVAWVVGLLRLKLEVATGASNVRKRTSVPTTPATEIGTEVDFDHAGNTAASWLRHEREGAVDHEVVPQLGDETPP